MKMIEELVKKIVFLTKVILVVLGTLLVILTFMDVISRTFGTSSISWANELARYLFIWFSFLGIIVVTSENKNLGVDFFYSKLPNKLQKIVKLIGYTLIMYFLLIMLKGGIDSLEYAARDVSPALGIPINYIYISIPISAGIMLLIYVLKYIKLLRNIFSFK